MVNPLDPDALRQILDLTAGGRGVDKAVDCSGVVAAHRLCIDAARRKGQVAFVGECSDDTPIQISDDMIRKGLTLAGSWHFNLADSPAHYGHDQRNRRTAGQIDHAPFPAGRDTDGLGDAIIRTMRQSNLAALGGR